MLLYECKVLLVSSICFFPTDEWTLVLDYCKSEPEFFLCVILCVYLLLYAVLHLTVAQILYTIISYLYLLLKFLLTCFNWFNTAFGSCGYFNLPIVRSQRQLILKHTLACTCIALFSSAFRACRGRGYKGLWTKAKLCTPWVSYAQRYPWNVYLLHLCVLTAYMLDSTWYAVFSNMCQSKLFLLLSLTVRGEVLWRPEY